MYVPRAFAMDDDRLKQFLAEPRSAQLVTATATGPDATLLPVMFRPEDGPHGTFVAHMSRVNPQWRSERHGESLLILSGPDGHIASVWTPQAKAAHTAVPTWNYLAVHVFGHLVVHDDPSWVKRAVTELARAFEPDYDIDELAEPYGGALIRAVVGIELRVTRILAKAKLSQNRSVEDLDSIVNALRTGGSDELADETAQLACPYAAHRDDVVETARRGSHTGG